MAFPVRSFCSSICFCCPARPTQVHTLSLYCCSKCCLAVVTSSTHSHTTAGFGADPTCPDLPFTGVSHLNPAPGLVHGLARARPLVASVAAATALGPDQPHPLAPTQQAATAAAAVPAAAAAVSDPPAVPAGPGAAARAAHAAGAAAAAPAPAPAGPAGVVLLARDAPGAPAAAAASALRHVPAAHAVGGLLG